MRKLFLLLSITMIFFGLKAQDKDTTYWKTGGVGAFTFQQLSLYQWSAGGENSFSGAALISVFANYNKDNTSWENTLDLGYGIVRQGDLTKKSNDRIELNSKYGRKASDVWYYSAMLNFKTQFTDGFNYPNDSVAISTFMAPAYLTTSVGMDYKPNENFTLFISPLSGKMTFVLNDSIADDGNFGMKAGENFRAEMGGFAKMIYKKEVMENVFLTAKLDLFSNYLKNPQNIDVNSEILVSMKINEYLAATLNMIMIYDDDVNVPYANDSGKSGPGIQVKEVFGLGLNYKF